MALLLYREPPIQPFTTNKRHDAGVAWSTSTSKRLTSAAKADGSLASSALATARSSTTSKGRE